MMGLFRRFKGMICPGISASYPYKTWLPFPPEAIVQIKNVYGESRIGRSITFWWGYEGGNYEGVIVKARRLDRVKTCT